ncbi:hypothetical protein CRG98_037744 [Punica granatum]|uniref:Uncharacterized protein n=1 Tax=Punica granatum TaxID=22663 RepID=A0A2I0ID06_PUNGR|nr:hypothetical protein CRG98_037744 [Punica granatum]
MAKDKNTLYYSFNFQNLPLTTTLIHRNRHCNHRCCRSVATLGRPTNLSRPVSSRQCWILLPSFRHHCRLNSTSDDSFHHFPTGLKVEICSATNPQIRPPEPPRLTRPLSRFATIVTSGSGKSKSVRILAQSGLPRVNSKVGGTNEVESELLADNGGSEGDNLSIADSAMTEMSFPAADCWRAWRTALDYRRASWSRAL